MTAANDSDELLDAISQGDRQARDALLARHRQRLQRMVAVRLDKRLAARCDPSDVVQEVLAEADRRLDDYASTRPIAYYPWLRQLALEQLRDLHRRHIRAQRRSISRERPPALPDESVLELAERLMDRTAGPSAGLRREERRQAVRLALNRLAERDREVLILRYLEMLSTADTAKVLEISEGAVKVRLLRALHRMREVLEGSEG